MVKRVLGQARQVNISCSLFVLLCLFTALPSIGKTQDETLEGLVIGITDGDTATVLLAGNKQEKVRLSEIDAPEFSQPYGNKSRQELAKLIFKQKVYAKVITHDRYRRPVARIFVNDLDVSAEMVKRGAAWFSIKYGKDSLIKDLEVEAKREKRGLWALPEKERIPPWEWRHPAKPMALAIPM